MWYWRDSIIKQKLAAESFLAEMESRRIGEPENSPIRPFTHSPFHAIFPWYVVGLLLLLILAPPPLSAQVGQNYFPADPANIYDWRSAMINPSISDFQNGAVDIGFKIIYLGFADNNASAFKASYVLLNVPRRLPYLLTGGFQLQLFSTPLYQETEVKFIFSRRIKRIYSVGLSFGLLGVSYNRDNFDLVDAGDPVFANGAPPAGPWISAWALP